MPQLDGLRAVAMMGVVYHHWFPADWRWHAPTEAGLFLFFLLSGFLMTQGLLREAEVDTTGQILRRFHLKRLQRIYPAYYVALALGALLGIKEIWHSPWVWLVNGQNFLIQQCGYWPPGAAHFWTLAVEQQYYLFWPLLILWVPRRALPIVLLLLALSAPVFRAYAASQSWWSVDLLPWSVIDQFALGSLWAYAMHHCGKISRRWLDAVGLIALLGYAWLYGSWELGHAVPHWCHWQQTLLAIVFLVLISRASLGQCGWFSSVLEHPWLTKLGQRSYGIYLFHNLAPLVAGKIFWFLWDDRLHPTLAIWLRIPVFALLTWGISAACHRWIESKINAIRVI
ncbi:MAG: hypothetical protein RL117_238 [Verrucomicrobiota bacterium]|jgi:peptidoglycan/LPS O-acetylase OafA/YrhL